MSNINLAYRASAALTITLASLATDPNLLTGRESNAVDNTSELNLDYILSGKITTGTSPTAAKEIRVYVAALLDDAPVWPDVFDGADSGETITSTDIRDAALALAAVLPTSNTSDRTYYMRPISVASLFGGVLPKKFVVFTTHNTGVNLNATAGNHAFYVTPVYESVA